MGLPLLLDKAPDGKEIKAGLIGCGGRGGGAASNFMEAGDRLKIVAIADLIPDRLEPCLDMFNNDYKQGVFRQRKLFWDLTDTKKFWIQILTRSS